MKKSRTEKCLLVSYSEVERIFRGNGFHTFIADPDNKYDEEHGDQQYNQKRSVLFHEQLVPSNLGRLQGGAQIWQWTKCCPYTDKKWTMTGQKTDKDVRICCFSDC
jgi:hypothetical protein